MIEPDLEKKYSWVIFKIENNKTELDLVELTWLEAKNLKLPQKSWIHPNGIQQFKNMAKI